MCHQSVRAAIGTYARLVDITDAPQLLWPLSAACLTVHTRSDAALDPFAGADRGGGLPESAVAARDPGEV